MSFVVLSLHGKLVPRTGGLDRKSELIPALEIACWIPFFFFFPNMRKTNHEISPSNFFAISSLYFCCISCRTSSTVHSMVVKRRLCTDKMARTSRKTATNSIYRNTPIHIWKELEPSVLLFVSACGKAGHRFEHRGTEQIKKQNLTYVVKCLEQRNNVFQKNSGLGKTLSVANALACPVSIFTAVAVVAISLLYHLNGICTLEKC